MSRTAVIFSKRAKIKFISPFQAVVRLSAMLFLTEGREFDKDQHLILTIQQKTLLTYYVLLLVRSLQELYEQKTSQLGNRGN